MSIEPIKEAILSEARSEAERIEADARRELQEQLAAQRDSIKAESERSFQQQSRTLERDVNQGLIEARSSKRLELLRMRNSILDDLFRRAGERVAALADDDYREMVRGWMEQVPADRAGELLCNERDAGRLAPLIDELNASRPRQAQLELHPGEVPRLGGVIFRTEKFELDLSVDSRLEHLREELAPEIASMIFPPEVEL